ncbi:MAG: TetR/AcrR family transcriptional regulator [Solirubrobacteraceae bacterium]
MPASPRQRMIQSAAVLIRERGVEATSFSDVIAHSGAPRGSIYHHFPGGKEQLVEEATRYAGEYLAAAIVAALATDDPRAVIRALSMHWAKILRNSDYGAGCPVVAATIDGTPAVRRAAGEAFNSWEKLLTQGLAPHLGDPGRAHSLATLAIAAIEGAVVLARAEQSTAPVERVATELELLLSAALER